MGFRKFVKNAKRIYQGGKSAIKLASQAIAGVKYIKGLVNAEKHYSDTSGNTTGNTTGSLVALSQIAVGDNRITRTGNSILCKGISLRGRVAMDPLITNTTARMILFMDTMNTGTAPTADQIVENLGTNLAPFQMLDGAQFGRFKILKSQLFSMSNQGKAICQFSHFIKLNTHIKYTGINATDYFKNAVFVLFLSDQAAGVSTPTFNWISRVYFYDN